MSRGKPENTHAYIATFPETVQKMLDEVRAVIKKAAPEAEEAISYGIPAFNYKGYNLIYFAGFKNHISIYPAPRGNDAFRDLLAAYKGGKGTVQFPLDKPIPFDLITKIVKFRMKENEQRAKKKTKE